MSEVTPEEQAAMAVILDDKVKELVRKHLKEAMEDYEFVNSFYAIPLADQILRAAQTPGTATNNLLTRAVAEKLMKW
jgi:hypothetical protein